MEDPFLLDRNRVESHLETVRQQFLRWRQLRDSDHQLIEDEDREDIEEEFHSLTTELSQCVKSIGWDLDDLQETLQMMLDAKAPQVTLPGARDSRAAFLTRSRGFLDEVAREIAMATTTTTNPTKTEPSDDAVVSMTGVAPKAKAPGADGDTEGLLSWRRDTDELSFPSVELSSLNDLRKARFHNRDWTGFIYRYRYLLAAVATVCLVIFLAIVILAAKHTAATARGVGAAGLGTTALPWSTTECVKKHFWSRC